MSEAWAFLLKCCAPASAAWSTTSLLGDSKGIKPRDVHRPSPLCCDQDMAGAEKLIPKRQVRSQAPEGQTHSCVSECPMTSFGPQGEATEGSPVALTVVVWDKSCHWLPRGGYRARDAACAVCPNKSGNPGT